MQNDNLQAEGYKTINIDKAGQTALMHTFSVNLKTEAERSLFKKAINGQEIDRRLVMRDCSVSIVFLAFVQLHFKGYISGMAKERMGRWIIENISAGTDGLKGEQPTNHTVTMYLKQYNLSTGQKKKLAAIEKLPSLITKKR